MNPYGPRPDRAQHELVVAAFQRLAERAPIELARCFLSLTSSTRKGWEVLDARVIAGPSAGPGYVVPAAPAPSPESTMGAVLGDLLVEGVKAASPGAEVKVMHFDFEEARRQSRLRGGHEVSLWYRAKAPRRRTPIEAVVGIALPDGDDDGRETPSRMLRKMGWYIQAVDALADPSGRRPGMDFLAMYLWPGTGLHDVQEECNVHRGPIELPGFLSKLPRVERPDASIRRMNTDRLDFHQRCDRERREAAARRAARMGAAGITEDELAALMPTIDVERDHVSFWLAYPLARVWDGGFDALLDGLPPSCVGLSLFSAQAEGVAIEEALRRCAWSLRKVPAAHRAEAAEHLADFASAYADPMLVRTTLRALKLL